MSLYDRRTGLWRDTGWWNSANALTSLVDYMIATDDQRYRWVVANTFDRARSAKGGSFTNDYLDDTGWWALAWIRAYDLTHHQRYLDTARADVDHMWSYHDDVCGGGVWWTVAKEYKNAITNELFVKAAAELHHRVPGDREYLRKALATWRWFRHGGMINADHLVNDGLDAGSCTNNHGTTERSCCPGPVDRPGDRVRPSARGPSTGRSACTGAAVTEPEGTRCRERAPCDRGELARHVDPVTGATSARRSRRTSTAGAMPISSASGRIVTRSRAATGGAEVPAQTDDAPREVTSAAEGRPCAGSRAATARRTPARPGRRTARRRPRWAPNGPGA